MSKAKDFNWREDLHEKMWTYGKRQYIPGVSIQDLFRIVEKSIEKVESSTIDKVEKMVKTSKDPYMLKAKERRFLKDLHGK